MRKIIFRTVMVAICIAVCQATIDPAWAGIGAVITGTHIGIFIAGIIIGAAAIYFFKK
jgi:hypothetical protein